MRCPHCHTDNREGAKFCDECGTPLAVPARRAVQPADDADAVDALSATAEDIKAEPAEEPKPVRRAHTAPFGGQPTANPPVRPAAAPAPKDDAASASPSKTLVDLLPVVIKATDDAKPSPSKTLVDLPPVVVEPDDESSAEPIEVDPDPDRTIAAAPMPVRPSDVRPAPKANPKPEILTDVDLEVEAADTAEIDPVGRDTDLTPYIPKRTNGPHATDFSGLDECLLDSSYVPPRPSWRTGDTMEMPRMDDQPPRQRDYRAPEAPIKKRNGGKVAVIAAVVVVLAVAAALVASNQMGLWGGTTMPDVVGMTQSDAEYVLDAKGFIVTVVTEASDEAEGLVLRSDPAPHARIDDDPNVTITVSIAHVIPKVGGMQRDEAIARLQEAGFENVRAEGQRSDAHEGIVLDVDPGEGSKAPSTTSITLYVAEPFTVPDVKGLTAEAAQAELEVNGYPSEIAYVYDDSVPDGIVLGTDPKADSPLPTGTTVVVSVAKSRALELEQVTLMWLDGLAASGEPLVIDGTTSFIVYSVDSVTFEGDNTVSFAVQGAATATVDGETLVGAQRSVTGLITWTEDNYIETISAQQQG